MMGAGGACKSSSRAGSLLTDVVVSNGLCPTHLAEASKEHFAVARRAEPRKHRAEEVIDQISLASG
jgi:hypothetical protein